MARKTTKITSEDKHVKKMMDVRIPSKNLIPKPSRPKNKSHSTPFKKPLSMDATIVSCDPDEIGARAIKRQKMAVGAERTFAGICRSEDDICNATTSTPQTEEDNRTSGNEPKEKDNTTSSDDKKEINDAEAGNKHEEHRSDLGTGTGLEEHLADQDKNAKPNITHALDPKVHHLQDKYKFTTMSIISSSQVGQKLNNLILQATEPAMMDDNTFSLAGVVVASAKGSVISKLISIAEKFMRATDGYGKTYYVYTSLKGVKQDKNSKSKEGGKTIREWKQQQPVAQPKTSKDKERGTAGEDQYATYDTDDEAPAFENMGPLQIMVQEQHQKKVHVVPQMAMYIARVPIPGLKALFPEQTNAKS